MNREKLIRLLMASKIARSRRQSSGQGEPNGKIARQQSKDRPAR